MSRVLPILFNTDMVRAILDGRKTVTRRLIKRSQSILLNKKEPAELTKEDLFAPFDGMTDAELIKSQYKLPYNSGDILYVRETYCPNYFDFVTQYGNRHGYKADYDVTVLSSDIAKPKKWIPSIHMPKEAARIWLKVTDVRVERLQDVTAWEAEKEGVGENCIGLSVCGGGCKTCPANVDNYVQAFRRLWNSTIKKSDMESYGWNANPWVWVVEFEQCGKPEEK